MATDCNKRIVPDLCIMPEQAMQGGSQHVRITVADLIRSYFEYCRTTGTTTIPVRERCLWLIQSAIGDYTADEIGPGHVRAMLQDLSTKRSRSALYLIKRELNNVFEHARCQGRIVDNPACIAIKAARPVIPRRALASGKKV